MRYWKFLRPGAVSPFAGYIWPVGEWVTADASDICRAGFHACRLADLPYWLADEMWEVELGFPVQKSRHKITARSARLISRVVGWTPDRSSELAVACVGRTVEHTVAELLECGLDDAASRMADAEEQQWDRVARECAELASARGAWQAVKLCCYVSDAIEAVASYPVASVAYIAARAAHQRSSAESDDPYAAERAWQATWLAENLRLNRS